MIKAAKKPVDTTIEEQKITDLLIQYDCSIFKLSRGIKYSETRIIKELKPAVIIIRSKALSFSEDILETQFLKQEMTRYIQIGLKYLSGQKMPVIMKKYNVGRQFIRTITKFLLCHTEQVESLIFQRIVFEKSYGLEKATVIVKRFYAKHNKYPSANDKAVGGITGAIARKAWESNGINTWYDFMSTMFGVAKFERNKYTGKKGLDRAIKEITQYNEEFGKIPAALDKRVKSITNAIYRGHLRSEGITGWNDLIDRIFGKVNFENHKYTGTIGLHRAIEELKAFQLINNKPPLSKDEKMLGIRSAVQRGEWISSGITKWNDLMVLVFGKMNKERNKYVGEDGLTNVFKKLKEFYAQKNRYPTSHDSFTSGIINAIYRGEWTSKGISKWNDLMTLVETNKETNIYVGQKGLELAKNEIIKLNITNGRTPSTSDEETEGIQSAIKRGEWYEFNIFTWSEFIKFCGLKVNKGLYSNLWNIWENWCEDAVSLIYKNNVRIQPQTRLPNNTIPDFDFLHDNFFIIGDAKVSANTGSIKYDIENYLPYCDKLEFWCLYRKRNEENYQNKSVRFVNPDEILSRINDESDKDKMMNKLQEIYAFEDKNSNSWVTATKFLLKSTS